MLGKKLPRLTVVLSTWGRFHFFHLARQIERRGWLEAIFTTYPRFKLQDEWGVPPHKIRSDPLLQTVELAAERAGAGPTLLNPLRIMKLFVHDRYMLKRLPPCHAFIALSGSGLIAGREVQRRGGLYLCERSSTHIVWQNRLLEEEFSRVGERYRLPPARFTEREIEEYAIADRIVVPSRFAARSFIEEGVSADKVEIASFGANLGRFAPDAGPPSDAFVALFVGQVSLRKGIPYLLEAFSRFRHPRKRLKIIGAVQREMWRYLEGRHLEGVEFLGIVPNRELPTHYSSAHVCILPSVEEGMAVVMGEALACGCPVIATPNSGAEDLFDHGEEGFIVPARDSAAITDAMTTLADNPSLRARLSEAALARMRGFNGWDRYGASYERILLTATKQSGISLRKAKADEL